MSQTNLPMLERLLVGGFAYFAEDGITVGADTIAEGTPPDVSAGYDDVPSLGCIEQVKPDTETSETEFLCPRESGGYEKKVEIQEIADYLDMQAQYYSEIVHRLQFGLENTIAADTPQSPFKKRNRKIDGWLACEAKKQDGTTLLQLLQRVEVRLNESPPWENAYGKPTLRFQIFENTSNAIEFT